MASIRRFLQPIHGSGHMLEPGEIDAVAPTVILDRSLRPWVVALIPVGTDQTTFCGAYCGTCGR